MTNPYNYSYPVSTPAMFFGRQQLIKEVVASMLSPSPRPYLILGGRKFGKTSTLKAIERELLSHGFGLGQFTVMPVYVDLNFEIVQYPQAFFQVLVRQLADAVKERLKTSIPKDWLMLEHDDYVRGFARVVQAIIAHCVPNHLRIVVLIDESDQFLKPTWAHDLYANLRSSLVKLHPYLVAIMVGSSRLQEEYHREGSQLRFFLKPRTIPSLSRQETESLIQKPSGLVAIGAISDAVWQETAGHPFLVQYIMFHLLESGLEHATADRVKEIARRFSEVEHRPDFFAWCEDLGGIGIGIYSELTRSTDNQGISHSTLIAKEIGDPTELRRSEDALCFYGIVERDSPLHFRTAGLMFRRWFVNEMLGQPHELETPYPQAHGVRKHLEDQQAEMERRYGSSGHRGRLAKLHQELQRRFESLTSQIAYLDTDIGREIEEFRKRPLIERLNDLQADRTEVSSQLDEIERQLADASSPLVS